MKKMTKQELLEDFKQWSGGFGPEECSSNDLHNYVRDMGFELLPQLQELVDEGLVSLGLKPIYDTKGQTFVDRAK